MKDLISFQTHAFLLFFCISAILCTSCTDAVIKKDNLKPGFYELCYSFPKLPENTNENDIRTASAAYEDYLTRNGITVLKRRHTGDSVCYFTDSIKDLSLPRIELDNNISQYLITAYFNRDHSSLYGVFPGKRRSEKIADNIPFLRKLPIYIEKQEGLVISGTNRKMLFVARYLDVLEIENEFGFNDKGKMVINVKPDKSDRWKMIPFLFDLLNLDDFVSLLPGDYAVLNDCQEDKVSLKLSTPSWEITQVPVAKDKGVINEDALVFSVSIMSLPFDEETLIKYFYTLSKSYLLPPSSGLYYSPNFKGSNVRPTVLLFSSELAISGEYIISPEMIYMWVSSVKTQLEQFPDAFYANLLSLKIAKKLYTGNPSFLGGEELVNLTKAVPFENIAKMLFHTGNVAVFGSINSSLYLFAGDIISEFSNLIEMQKAVSVKALFGSPDNSDRSIISFVVRSANAEVITDRIGADLKKEGFSPFQLLFEQVSLNDAWGSVSVSVDKKSEKKILDLYEKRFKLLNNTLSVGVYRVAKEE